MKLWRTVCLIGFGGFLEAHGAHAGHDIGPWTVLLGVAAVGWSWTWLGKTAFGLRDAFVARLTGRAQALPTTDPKALAAEVAALNAQIAALRDTATSFDVSFDQTLARMDERLRRVEQQSPYVQVGQKL